MAPTSALIAAMSLAVILLGGGCANDSPAPGEGCVSVGGVCTSAVCVGGSLPYACPGSQSCCTPGPDGG
jgi:hypothetical protein